MSQVGDTNKNYFLRKLRLFGPKSISASDVRALRKEYSADVDRAILTYKSRIKPPKFSQSICPPKNAKLVDWLISIDPAYSQSKIASWVGRNNSAVLKLVAKLYALCPEILTSPGSFIEKPEHNDISAIEWIMDGANWSIELIVKPISEISAIDRRSSMFGGWPWTCKQYPWPEGRSGRMSPIVQLNLRDLNLSLIGHLPPVMLQVWGDGLEFYCRTIMVEDISLIEPDQEFFGHEQENIYYDMKAAGNVGVIIETGKNVFQIDDVWLRDTLLSGLSDRVRNKLDHIRLEKVEDISLKIADKIELYVNSLPDFAEDSHFGGYQSGMYDLNYKHNGRRSLLWIGEGKGNCLAKNQNMQTLYITYDLDRDLNSFAEIVVESF